MASSFSFEELNPALIANVELPPEVADRLVFAPALGFAAMSGGEGGLHVVGFHADASLRTNIVPAITLEERPTDRRYLDANAKGLGITLGNTEASISRPREDGIVRHIGLYMTPELQPDEIVARQSRDPLSMVVMGKGIVRHAGLMAIERFKDSERAISRVEKRYGDANLATIDPAPRWLLKQNRHDHIIPPVWAVWRDRSRREITRIGVIRPESHT